MRNAMLVGICAAGLVGACKERTPATDHSGTPAPAPEARGGGPTEAVRGTGEAIEAAGHGVVYGARELGQTLSGTQGNPEAEARAEAARRAMERSAAEADQHFDNAGEAAREAIHRDTAPPAERSGRHRAHDDRVIRAPNDR